ncbi:MAG: HAMP domain-containing histidine kinase [Chrysiogenetes bacterium]|nr:HAMP domain-containing histidine kinase [Chrysiogenetes bacterium]
MPTPETPQGDTKADEFAEFEKDIEGYLGRLERWADLSRYDRYLGRLRSVLGHAYFLFGGEREGYQRYRRAAFARIVILSSFLMAAMLAPMFYDYLPIAGAYSFLNAILIVLILFRVAPRAIFAVLAALDVFVITFAIHLFGSLTSVVVVFYPLLVTLASLFLNFFWGLAYAAMCSGAYALIVSLEYFGVLPYSPLLGHRLPAYEFYGIPTFPIVVLLVAHMINYGSAFCAGLLTYEVELRRRVAEAAVQTKNEMLAVCSHDLKNILVSVGGYSELLVMELDGSRESALTHAREIHGASQRMLELISNLLDSARLEGGKIVLSRSHFSYGDLVHDVEATQTANARLKNTRLKFVDCGADPAFYADRSKLVQAFTNLVQNAVIHTPEGGTITMELARVAEGRARIAVRDSGTGIPPEVQAILFDPMALARRRKHENQKIGNALSTGLGLSIVKRFVEMHGGRIWVESEPGEGSVFWVELPSV